ncbi:nucleoside 2-deoxyribosyltransferase [Bacteroides sp. Ga6A2]|uniref:nucleoside 2-deoxyribosyltransferase n=1 Tax=unclassified Bacteroides TaxID=2646097 RepID=UPI00350ED988
MKVYFAGSIRGGRIDANLYERLIKYIQKTDIVLTEHVGNLNLSEEGQTVTDIYNQDTNWLRESDVLIAEWTYILHIPCIYLVIILYLPKE